jgi:fructokinase
MAAAAAPPPSVLVVGEALWDGLPAGLFLGGAPCNVGVHVAQLGRRAAVATRVGRDQLGEEIVARLAARGVHTALIQHDDAHRTGFVRVVMTGSEPTYDIVRPSAWDFLEPCEALTAAAAAADAVVFGSLAQREPASRATIQALARAARRAVFDVNLRAPFVMRDVVEASAAACWLLKLNDGEAQTLAEWFGLPAGGDAAAHAAALRARFGCHVVVTRGGDGAVLALQGDGLVTHAGCKVKAVDAVGAGDAFLASLLDGLLKEEARRALRRGPRVCPGCAAARVRRCGNCD